MQLKTINSHLYFAPVWAYGNVCPDATKWVKSIIQTSDVTSEKQGNGKKDQLWPHLCEKKENTNIAHLDKVVEMFRAQIGNIHQESLHMMTAIMISLNKLPYLLILSFVKGAQSHYLSFEEPRNL